MGKQGDRGIPESCPGEAEIVELLGIRFITLALYPSDPLTPVGGESGGDRLTRNCRRSGVPVGSMREVPAYPRKSDLLLFYLDLESEWEDP